MPYGSLRGLREMVLSIIPPVGLATRPVYFAMALSTNVLRLSLLGLLVLTESRWAMLVITMWFLTWDVVECGGRPFWVKPNLENVFLLCDPLLAREPVVLGVERVRYSEWEHQDLIKGSGGNGFILGFSEKWER
jgi:hypothetical protein